MKTKQWVFIAVTAIIVMLLHGCMGPKESEENASVSMKVYVNLKSSNTGLSEGINRSALGTVNDVSSVTVGIKLAGSSTVVAPETVLVESPLGSGNWVGTFTDLPTNTNLDFTAIAYDDLPQAIFTDVVTSILFSGNNNIVFYMESIDDGISPDNPSIISVLLPSEVETGSTIDIRFSINHSGGVDYTASAIFGSLDPTSGSHNPDTDLHIQYTAASDVTQDYLTLMVKDPALNDTISLSIPINVVSVRTTGGVSVLFGPVITGMNFLRQSNDLQVSVSTDPTTDLIYSWTGTGDFATVTGITNPISISPFDDSFEGSIQSTVTDANGIQASLTRTIAANDFPYTINAPVSPIASRTTGVAPLAVFFDSGFKTLSGTAPFHNYEYSWDFGDITSDFWSREENTSSTNSKNKANGPVSAHVFETAGSYTVTLTVKNGLTVLSTNEISIQVQDPDVIYSGINTICMTSVGDFSGCPSGALQDPSSDITEISNYLGTGKRVLLDRGSSWTVSTTSGIASGIPGPVSLGAYGSCTTPDSRGICSNAPQINFQGAIGTPFIPIDNSPDWRIYDINFVGDTGDSTATSPFVGGNTDISQLTLLRIKATGFSTAAGNDYWQTNGHDQISIVDSDFSGAESNVLYIGSERIAIIGNSFQDSIGVNGGSHVVRIWQAYYGVISHNVIAGSSINNNNGRHAIKLHGPNMADQVIGGDRWLENPESKYLVVSNNLFGASGPWSIFFGPEDVWTDERVSDIIFEKNRVIANFGSQSSSLVQASLIIWSADTTVRNNVFDGLGSSRYYRGIVVRDSGISPSPDNAKIYNNTIYNSSAAEAGGEYVGIDIYDTASNVVAKNNLVTLPTGGFLIRDQSADLIQSNNLLTDTPGMVDPDNGDILQRSYNISSSSVARDSGTAVNVFEDFLGNSRLLDSSYDIGAFEYTP